MSGGDRERARPAGTDPFQPVLVAGVEFLGEYQGSGYREAPCLLRLDRRTIEVSPLLYAVCTLLDGRRDLSDIAELVSEAFGRLATADDVTCLIEHKLRPLGVVALQLLLLLVPPVGIVFTAAHGLRSKLATVGGRR